MIEKDLKHWLSLTYNGQIAFVEPAYGGSVGMPDVEVPIFKHTLPIELKIGWRTKRGEYRLDMRPSQRRYHIMAAERGQKTAVMFAIGERSYKFDVFLFDGRLVENDQFTNGDGVICVARSQHYNEPFNRDILEAHFWCLIDGRGK